MTSGEDGGRVARQSCLDWPGAGVAPSETCRFRLQPVKAAHALAVPERSTPANPEGETLALLAAPPPGAPTPGGCRNEGRAVVCPVVQAAPDAANGMSVDPPARLPAASGLSGASAPFQEASRSDETARRRDPAAQEGRPRACTAGRPNDSILVLDASTSMGLPVDMPIAREADLDRRMAEGDKAAIADYRTWLSRPGLTRLDHARQAVRHYLAQAGSARVGAVTFRGCSAQDMIVEPPSGDRRGVEGLVGRMQARRNVKTALDASLRAAAATLGDRSGHILLLTDGQETCGGDPCRAAAEIAARSPGVRIDVIGVGGHTIPTCMAELTGGRADAVAATDAAAITASMMAAAASYCR